MKGLRRGRKVRIPPGVPRVFTTKELCNCRFFCYYDFMLKTQHPKIDELIKELAEDLSNTLGNDLKGVYLFGSLVIGDFDPKRSDIDLLAMVAEDINRAQLNSLKQMHDDLVQKHPEWHNRIEVAYVSVGGMKNFKTKTCQIARISPGEPIHYREMDINWLMDWYMVLRYGQTVLGPSPEEFIPDISTQEFIDSLKNYAPIWIKNVKEAHHVGYQSYIILSLCRSLYVYAHGEQVSKIEAADWAAIQYPDWAELIKNALSWKGSPDNSKSPETRAKTEEFVKFALAETEAKF